jgi:hypothetical protein
MDPPGSMESQMDLNKYEYEAYLKLGRMEKADMIRQFL